MRRAKQTVAALIYAALSLLVAMPSMAGSIIKLESRDFQSNPPRPGTVTFAIDGPAMRMDSSDATSDNAGSFVFRSDVNEMTAIDHSRKEYFVLDEQALESIAGQVNDAMQQMQAALAELPPDQRAMAEKMMQQRMGSMGQTAEPTALAKSGGSDTVNGYDCETYEVTEAGRTIRELCVTKWSNVEGGAEFSQSMMKIAGFFENMREMFSRNGMGMMGSQNEMFSHMREINGFPVRTREYDRGGNVVEETTLVSSESQSVDPAVFRPPAGYSQQSLQR